MPENKPESKTPLSYKWILGVLALALIVRLLSLGAKSFYEDEGYTLFLAQGAPGQVISKMLTFNEPHPPLHFLLINMWNRLWPIFKPTGMPYEAFTRLSTVIFSLAGIYMLYLLGVKLFNRRTALLAAVFITLSSFHIRYSQEIRMYIMVLFFITGSFYFLIRLMEERNVKNVVLYALCTGLAPMTHYFGFLVYPVAIIFLALEYGIHAYKNGKNPDGQEKERFPDGRLGEMFDDPGELRGYLKYLGSAMAASVPLFIFWLPYGAKVILGPGGRMERVSADFSRLLVTVGSFFAGFTIPWYHALLWLAFIPLIIFILAFVFYNNASYRFLLIWFLFPIIFSFLASKLLGVNIFELKYSVVSLPAFWLIIGGFLEKAYKEKTKWAKAASAVMIILIIAANLYSGYNLLFNKQFWLKPWRTVGQFVESRAEKDEVVIVHPFLMWPVFKHYYEGKTPPRITNDRKAARTAELLKESGGVWLVHDPFHPVFRGKNNIRAELRKRYPYRVVFRNSNYYILGMAQVDYYYTDREKLRNSMKNTKTEANPGP